MVIQSNVFGCIWLFPHWIILRNHMLFRLLVFPQLDFMDVQISTNLPRLPRLSNVPSPDPNSGYKLPSSSYHSGL